MIFFTTSCCSTHLPPSAWKTTDSFPVLMQPLMFSSTPAFTILYISRRVRGSTACSWAERKRVGVWSSRSTPHHHLRCVSSVYPYVQRWSAPSSRAVGHYVSARCSSAASESWTPDWTTSGPSPAHHQHGPLEQTGGGEESICFRSSGDKKQTLCQYQRAGGRLTLSMRAVFLRPQVSSSCLVVMFLPFPVKPLLGVVWGLSDDQTHRFTLRHTVKPSTCDRSLRTDGETMC